MEFRLRGMLASVGQDDVSIGSAGTQALEGHPMASPMSERLRERGVDSVEFRAVVLRQDAIDAASLIITATREHRRQVVRLRHDAAERTFTLAQLARLLNAVPGDTPRTSSAADVVSAAHAARGRSSGASAADDDLTDPWRRSRRTYRRVADRIDVLLRPVATHLVVGD